jgi:hypothetical protein
MGSMQAPSLKPPLSEPAIVYADHEHAVGVYANTLISFSLAEPTRPYLDSWKENARKLVTTYEHIAAVNVIDGSAKPPSDAVRFEIKQLIASLSANFLAIAIVIEGTGFLAAAKRSALSMITLMSRQPCPIRIFGTMPEAANWLISQVRSGASQGGLEMRGLVGAAGAVRAALKSKP